MSRSVKCSISICKGEVVRAVFVAGPCYLHLMPCCEWCLLPRIFFFSQRVNALLHGNVGSIGQFPQVDVAVHC